ncbi:PREDICTED: protein ABHD16B [Gavialis gangeticus]|uniref:protein ABHD16B n=1 Tax=Gavialis gangeticus TaxID=94835 RepID=UPI00092FC7E6|nr:PREDICTED: protein ABHD16B [Gavialis gangeticus]
MCVICFGKALGHVFTTYLAASYKSQFRSWPVDFRWDEAGGHGPPAPPCPATVGGEPRGRPASAARGRTNAAQHCSLLRMKQLPGQLASYVLARSVGRWLLYPGSISLLQKALQPLLVEGQARLLGQFHGKRAKLVARDGNQIDTMFVDRRRSTAGGEDLARGKQLVICCEGNVGFYEVGCLATPLEAGYSALGWNHPGYAGSTGLPFPRHDANAMEVVVQYAMNRLGFQLQDILLYGWSLGGYTATWAAMTYPQLGALVLDATFDHLLPLALKVMPKSWSKLVARTVQRHFNLNVAEQLCAYPGPVLLIRRTLDQVTATHVRTTDRLADIRSNRGNKLLLRLLRSRYPEVMVRDGEVAVHHWLRAASPAQEAAVCRYYQVEEDWCIAQLQAYKSSLGPGDGFPWRVGKDTTPGRRQQLALFLATKYMKNVEATHWTLLLPNEFQMPWKL